MAPVRRYLRISKYSVLECRIYLDNPALVQSWLLNPRDPVLPRVIESVRPWVLPKLREERERAKKKSSNRKKGIKDTVVEDDFKASIFLTETDTRHSILMKHKHFHDNPPPKMQSNTNKLIDETNNVPVDVDAYDNDPVLQEGESDDDSRRLADIPFVPEGGNMGVKRHRNRQDDGEEFDMSEGDEPASAIEIDSDAEQPAPKRVKEAEESGGAEDADDKKKLAMDVSYEGFAIYGRVLCLVVHKRDGPSQKASAKKKSPASSVQPGGQASMENWITSTQIPVGEDVP